MRSSHETNRLVDRHQGLIETNPYLSIEWQHFSAEPHDQIPFDSDRIIAENLRTNGLDFQATLNCRWAWANPARKCVRRPDESHTSAIPIEYRV